MGNIDTTDDDNEYEFYGDEIDDDEELLNEGSPEQQAALVKHIGEFAQNIILEIVDNKDVVNIRVTSDQNEINVVVKAPRVECARLIGRHGSIKRALDLILKAISRKHKFYITLNIRPPADEPFVPRQQRPYGQQGYNQRGNGYGPPGNAGGHPVNPNYMGNNFDPNYHNRFRR